MKGVKSYNLQSYKISHGDVAYSMVYTICITYLKVAKKVLDWPKSSFGFFYKNVWKNSNSLFGQPNRF